MSFRLFVYYSALCGGWAALVGWLLGVLFAPGSPGQADLGRNGIIGMFLGLMIATGLGLVDALWILPWQRFGQILLRVMIAVVIGAVGGLVGGMIGHVLYDFLQIDALLMVGWMIVGLLCGASVGSFDLLAGVIHQKNQKAGRAKVLKCLIGGAMGGIVGGGLALLCRTGFSGRFILAPTAMGFVALGACIGLLVGLAQVILKEAWVKVESGFRAGREMLLAKDKISVGRAEGSDVALFGDSGVEKLHAHIVLDNGRYYLEDNATPGGTFLNDQRVNGRTPLSSGDRIQIGKSVLRFYERTKRR
ncbi:MAG: FHA domain-containing protein [Gemmataceae bacterium]|nr:FHA domain-containing protein [Gemmataceae bacterium]